MSSQTCAHGLQDLKKCFCPSPKDAKRTSKDPVYFLVCFEKCELDIDLEPT